ncbi:MAG: tetratricopeptide repeat protein [Acidobacteria bacterium]|nr:tetratricopeptide repeat protein [Acidobacteriota bacterium]
MRMSYAGKSTTLTFLILILCVLTWDTAAQKPAKNPKLKNGSSFSGELAKDQTNSYRIKLHRDEFLSLSIIQRRGDIIASLVDESGQSVIEVDDRRKDDQEPEQLSFIAELNGDYRLNVRSSGKSEETAVFELAVTGLRKATEKDKMCVSAEQAMRSARALASGKEPEKLKQAVERYQATLSSWQKLGDKRREADAQRGMGRALNSLGEYDRAMEAFNKALALRRELSDRRGEARLLADIGDVHESKKQFREAVESFKQSLPLLREAGLKRDEAVTLTNIGADYHLMREYKLALDFFAQAVTVWKTTDSRSEEAGAHVRAGRTHESLNSFDKAIESYQLAFALYQAAADQAGEASMRYDLGIAYRQTGRNKEALESLEQALRIWQTLEKKNEQASTHNYLGMVNRTLGENQKAIDHYTQAISLSRELKNPRLEATVLNNMALINFALGDYRRALDTLAEVLPLRRANKDRAGEASTLTNLGAINANLGQNEQALDFYSQALPIWREENRKGEEAIVTHNIGETYDRLGEKQKALDQFTRALALIKPIGAKQLEGQTTTSMATLYFSLGEYQRAKELYLASLDVHRATGNKTDETLTLNQLGYLHYEIDENETALKYLEAAMVLWKQIGDVRGEAVSLNTIANVHRSLGESEKSIGFADQAISLHQKVGNRGGEAEALIIIGQIAGASGERGKAIDALTRAIELSRAVSDPSLESKARYEIARVELESGNLTESRGQIEETLRIVETLRTKVASQELRSSYFATVQKYYDLYIDLLMQMHERDAGKGFDGEALQASERARARSLIEMLTEANARIREGVAPQLLDRERLLQQQLNEKADSLARLYTGNFTAEQVNELKSAIDSLTSEFQEVRSQIRLSSPRYAALTQPSPLTLDQIQNRILDDETVLLEYALGEKRSFLWMVSRQGMSSHALPDRSTIEALARQTHQLFSKPNSIAAPPSSQRRLKYIPGAEPDPQAAARQAFNELSRMLLGPVAGKLGTKRLLIVAEGALQYVPFAALIEPAPRRTGRRNSGRTTGGAGAPLIINHEIVSLPSASTLAVIRNETADRQPAPELLAILADPVFEKDDERVHGRPDQKVAKPAESQGQTVAGERLIKHLKQKDGQTGPLRIPRLPFTREEAGIVSALVPPANRLEALDFAANRTTATSESLSRYRYLHFATHGYLDSERPELSALVLSLVNEKGAQQSGFLYAHEVYNLKLPAEVVVLSACETGLGKEIRGEGLVGLTRGFMYAGAPRVVVSLWSVNDKATAELMGAFYRHMLAEGMRPAAALRAAQIEMLQKPHWQSPYFWAAFVLQGEWK